MKFGTGWVLVGYTIGTFDLVMHCCVQGVFGGNLVHLSQKGFNKKRLNVQHLSHKGL